jgi:hypothetical protein
MTYLSLPRTAMHRAFAASLAFMSGLFAPAFAFGGETQPLIDPVVTSASSTTNETTPQAEASAIKSPVELTLEVYRTELKRRDEFEMNVDWAALERDHPPDEDGISDLRGVDKNRYIRRKRIRIGEPLWIKIRLTNLGKKPMFVLDDLFTGPEDFQQALEERHSGVSLIILTHDGQPVKWMREPDSDIDLCPEAEPISHAPPDPKLQAKVDAWKRDGYSLEKINAMLDAESKAAAEARTDAPHPFKKLETGESIATGPWRYRGRCKLDSAKLPQQVGDFGELWNYHLDIPGVYTIKARYFADPYANHGKQVEIETAPIKITVLP